MGLEATDTIFVASSGTVGHPGEQITPLALVGRSHFFFFTTLKLKCGFSLYVAGEKLDECQKIERLVSCYMKPVQGMVASLIEFGKLFVLHKNSFDFRRSVA